MSKLAAIEIGEIGSDAHTALFVVGKPFMVTKGATTELVTLLGTYLHQSIFSHYQSLPDCVQAGGNSRGIDAEKKMAW